MTTKPPYLIIFDGKRKPFATIPDLLRFRQRILDRGWTGTIICRQLAPGKQTYRFLWPEEYMAKHGITPDDLR